MHRLDARVSGLVVVAKTSRAAAALRSFERASAAAAEEEAEAEEEAFGSGGGVTGEENDEIPVEASEAAAAAASTAAVGFLNDRSLKWCLLRWTGGAGAVCGGRPRRSGRSPAEAWRALPSRALREAATARPHRRGVPEYYQPLGVVVRSPIGGRRAATVVRLPKRRPARCTGRFPPVRVCVCVCVREREQRVLRCFLVLCVCCAFPLTGPE